MSATAYRIVFWTARVLAALVAGLILLIFIGEAVSDGLGPLSALTLRESLMMAAFAATFLGLVLGWLWERLAGWLVAGGMAAFYLLDFAFSGTFPRGGFFLVILLPGLLYLLSGYNKPAANAAA